MPSIIGEVLVHQLRNQFSPQILDPKSLDNIRVYIPWAEDSCLSCLSCWKDFYRIEVIDPINSRQYATFLAVLARTLYKENLHHESNIIAYLNKSLNGCEIYGHVPLKPNFLIGHTPGIVLGTAIYGDHLCLHHNITVGRWMDACPKLGSRVIILNGAIVAGNSVIGDNSIISAGVRVINQHVPPGSIAFNGQGKQLVFKPNRNNWIDHWLLPS